MFENGLVGVVIVTFNRLNKLKITLKSFEKQTVKPAYILVLNNASTDETKEYLENWKLTVATYSKYVINSDNNMGGSGGFHKGMYEALHLPAKWIWVQDDDAFPATNAIEIATAFLNTNTDKWDSISAICGKVVNKNRIDTAHRRIIYEKRYGRILCRDVKTEMYSRDCFKINAFSYVGTVINTNKLLEVGLTNKDFFIWFDDTEHSLRLSRKGSILCIPAIEIVHNVEQSASDTTWKNYYGVRNRLYTYNELFSKRCFRRYYFKYWLKARISILMHKKIENNQMVLSALEDARNGKLGIHKIYKPGWEPKKK